MHPDISTAATPQNPCNDRPRVEKIKSNCQSGHAPTTPDYDCNRPNATALESVTQWTERSNTSAPFRTPVQLLKQTCLTKKSIENGDKCCQDFGDKDKNGVASLKQTERNTLKKEWLMKSLEKTSRCRNESDKEHSVKRQQEGNCELYNDTDAEEERSRTKSKHRAIMYHTTHPRTPTYFQKKMEQLVEQCGDERLSKYVEWKATHELPSVRTWLKILANTVTCSLEQENVLIHEWEDHLLDRNDTPHDEDGKATKEVGQDKTTIEPIHARALAQCMYEGEHGVQCTKEKTSSVSSPLHLERNRSQCTCSYHGSHNEGDCSSQSRCYEHKSDERVHQYASTYLGDNYYNDKGKQGDANEDSATVGDKSIMSKTMSAQLIDKIDLQKTVVFASYTHARFATRLVRKNLLLFFVVVVVVEIFVNPSLISFQIEKAMLYPKFIHFILMYT
ncbi:hypothetical protein RFI_29843 [Reticulomyxa filosa]|uniref:Uncharacterized protein n=1 Tax=Reticulomyxa filosa TaxID=46433 RepID=X6M3F0_RETFI|nr:hypothetical protein RFI_29843 [Reticulomyxa filosa]|eukprot:ETO07550.1 hypothetical protein RFI_29843 [Reticulomyxa filosa]